MEVFLFLGAPSGFLLEHHSPLVIEDSCPVEGFVGSGTGASLWAESMKTPFP